MKALITILERPYLVVLIATLIAFLSLQIDVFYCLVLTGVIFTTSIIYTISQKKWSRLTSSILGYFAFLVLWIGFILFKGFYDELKPEVEIGDSDFYLNEILTSSNIKIPKDLKIISKLDTITYIGIEDEYDAECLYTGPSRLIIKLENNIISNKEFSKAKELVQYPTEVLNSDNFNLNDLKSVYIKDVEGRSVIYIAFNKDNSKLYYSAFYY